MNKLRLLLWADCDRACEGCCNKDWDLVNLPVCKDYTKYDMIILTGGEPLLYPLALVDTIAKIRHQVYYTPIIVYTAMTKDIPAFFSVLKQVDGVTLTVHTQEDVRDFMKLQFGLLEGKIRNKSMRLNVFKGVEIPFVADFWDTKYDMEWEKDCPLPTDEVFMKLS